MLFRRRDKPPLRNRLRDLFWPRRGFARAWRYYGKRVLRIRATPHAIAAGVAVGVFSAFTPFLGFHIVLAAVLAWLIGGNVVASAISTFVGNPATYPLIWAGTYEVGRLILSRRHPTGRHVDLGAMLRHFEFRHAWRPLIEPMLVGALPLGLAFGLAAYAVTRWGAAAFQAERKKSQRDRERLAAAARP